MLEVEHIDVFYGEFQALHDISVRVETGQLVSIFGPNGHGKSTLLKTICGLMKPAGGVIRFEGREIQLPAAPFLGQRHLHQHTLRKTDEDQGKEG